MNSPKQLKGIAEADAGVLQLFLSALDVASSVALSGLWDPQLPVDDWNGIRIDTIEDRKRVVSINLKKGLLFGILLPLLLQWHQRLTMCPVAALLCPLPMSAISGSLPRSWIPSGLEHLKVLDLRHNCFRGAPPSYDFAPRCFTNCRHFPPLTGSIPPEIFQLRQLEVLRMSRNSLSGKSTAASPFAF